MPAQKIKGNIPEEWNGKNHKEVDKYMYTWTYTFYSISAT